MAKWSPAPAHAGCQRPPLVEMAAKSAQHDAVVDCLYVSTLCLLYVFLSSCPSSCSPSSTVIVEIASEITSVALSVIRIWRLSTFRIAEDLTDEANQKTAQRRGSPVQLGIENEKVVARLSNWSLEANVDVLCRLFVVLSSAACSCWPYKSRVRKDKKATDGLIA